jgi:hypothetical protein
LKFGNLKTVVKKLTSEIFHMSGTEQKLELLIKSWKFNLPMATTILTVLYPQEFTIYDMRVRGQIGICNDFSGRKDQIKRYFDEFLPKVKRLGKGKNLRNKDRYLWGKSFYQDLMKLLKRVN